MCTNTPRHATFHSDSSEDAHLNPVTILNAATVNSVAIINKIYKP
jgi:hypothetical protein